MNLAEDLIKPFLNHFHKCPAPPTKSNVKDQLFQDLTDAFVAQRATPLKAVFQPKVTRPLMFKNSQPYFPPHIQHYVEDNENGQFVFRQKMNVTGSRVFTLYMSKFTDDADANKSHNMSSSFYTDLAEKMFVWLRICIKYAKESCATNLNIFCYPTPFLKELPDSRLMTLGPDHVNTALTKACIKDSEILIYRQEEMFKVFIHETFHAFGLDLGDQPEMCSELKKLYPIASTFNAAEGYSEMWARIMNCAFCAYMTASTKGNNTNVNNTNVNNKKLKQPLFADFCLYFDFCLQMERIFAIYQCHKVLAFMGLTYDNLHDGSNKASKYYSEDTNVFAYYILTAIFFSDVDAFLNWCKATNTNLYQFKRTTESCNALIEYIKQHYKGAYMRKRLALGQVGPKIGQTTRMTLFD